jgi:hypothetical protein
MHAPLQEVTGGHDGPRGGGSRQSSSEFGLQPERHSVTDATQPSRLAHASLPGKGLRQERNDGCETLPAFHHRGPLAST